MALEAQILTGLKWTAGARFGGQILTWAISILVMRLLQPSDYGLVAMASVALVFLNMFAELGLGTALVQAAEARRDQLRQAQGIFILLNVGLCLLLNLGAPVLATLYAEPRLELILRALSLQFLVVPLGVISDIQLQRQLEYKQRSLIELSSAVVTSLCTLAMAFAGAGVWALVWPNLVGALWRAVVLNVASPFPYWPQFRLRGMRRLLTFGGIVTLSRFLWTFFTQVDVMIIGRVLGREVLGYYSVAMHLATLPVQRVTAIINQVGFPALARIQEERQLLRSYLLRVVEMLSLIAIPVLWGISATSREIVLVLLGAAWSDAAFPLQALTLVMPFRTLVGFLPTVTDAIGRPEISMQNVILGTVCMLPAFYVGSFWGMVGVAMAWLLAYPVVLLLNAQRMLKVLDLALKDLGPAVLRSVACGAVMYLAVTLARLALLDAVDKRVQLVAEVVVGALAYLGMTWSINRAALQGLFKFLGWNK
ncbi:lipopolysaccharide biosynthesis protein [Pseudoduganella sp. UC29_106]|uniref:lipopolysaccharide biosynthesis protein n=1 Tax=Pseudoduganella sp. UC29_106 TaxID=3374553 RepID=UPI0037567780